ncbi:MAG: glycosyltransferase family 4 protein, partial [Phycisphaerae bacterium]|nr:glycosyltransferase family 4 protein [Phycisphaerae bacterium]
IAMLGSRGIPARAGGVERVVQELTDELVARGHEVVVYCRRHYTGPEAAGPAGPRRAQSGLRTILTPGLAGKHLDAITHTATAAIDVLRRNVDVVHIHSPGPAMMSWLPALAGRSVVLTVHAPDWRRAKWSLPARAVLRAGLSCGMCLARAVTCVSRPLAEELSREFAREVVYIPNAARPARPRAAKAIRRWGLAADGYVLYVGRIVPEKRLDLLLDAFMEAGTSAKLVVVGDPHENAYGRRCLESAGENVLFLGPQYGEVLAELYSNAAVFVLPSELEGMSLVLLEAAAYGRCIIASDIDANVATLADAALYFKCGRASELAGQIRRCLSGRPLRRELGRQALSHVGSHYCWSEAAERMEKIYLETIARSG